ncbi:MAG: aspartate aminotransferase family protein [Chitinophagales bacterium]|nr:aspartate aminotransferase family protein [Chitinophagales bacterium]
MAKQFILPKNGTPANELLDRMESFKSRDLNWTEGKFFGYVFYPGEEIYEVSKKAYLSFYATNGLNPSAFPSLRKMETEVIGMTADMLNGDENTTGTMTSGGTESIMMAVLSAREWAHKHKSLKGIPEVLAPASAHPAFPKACHFFGLKYVEAPLMDDYRVNVAEMKKLITSNTVLMVASAPQYPQGVIDPVEEVAGIAKDKGILCHVDCCVGGYLLPFLEKGGVELPRFDFRVPGVTSISADTHKYGYAAKGASTILYRNSDLRRGQFYIKTDWTGGIYGSPSFAGTRPGGAIAAAWAVMNFIGEERYIKMQMAAYHTTQKLKKGVLEIEGLKILGNPNATLFAIASDKYDVHVIADEMHHKGWYLNRQQLPPSIHIFVTDIHIGKEELFLNDLRDAVKKAGKLTWDSIKKSVQIGAVKGLKKILKPESFNKLIDKANSGNSPDHDGRQAAMYGMMGALKGTDKLDELVEDFIDQLNSPEDTKDE